MCSIPWLYIQEVLNVQFKKKKNSSSGYKTFSAVYLKCTRKPNAIIRKLYNSFKLITMEFAFKPYKFKVSPNYSKVKGLLVARSMDLHRLFKA